MEFKFPKDVEEAISTFEQNGFEAFVVGGAIRNILLNTVPIDFDIAHNASEDDLNRMFGNAVPIGDRYGVMVHSIQVGNTYMEVAHYRAEDGYTDYKHPDSVRKVDTIEEDLSRRDLTINAMAFGKKAGESERKLIDLFGGQDDINKGVVNFVGDPNQRVREHPIRMVRAIRFAAEYNLTLSAETMNAIKANAGLIQEMPNELILKELDKIVLADPNAFMYLYGTKLLYSIFEEFHDTFLCEQNHPMHKYKVGTHCCMAAMATPKIRELRWAALLHDIGKPFTKTTDEKGIDHFYGHAEESAETVYEGLTYLRMDKKTVEEVVKLVKYHDVEFAYSKSSAKRWLNKLGIHTLRNLIELKRADMKAQNQAYYAVRNEKLKEFESLLEQVVRDRECVSLKDLSISGSDLLLLGYKQGPQIGRALLKMLDAVIENPKLNTKEFLSNFAVKLLSVV